MSDTIIGIYKDFGGFGQVDDEHLIIKGVENGAQDGDTVEIINISKNPNQVMYKVLSVIDETKELVENISENVTIYEGVYRKSNEGKGGYVKFSRKEKDVIIKNGDLLGLKSGDKIKFAIILDEKGNKEGLFKEKTQSAGEQLQGALDFFKDDTRIDIFKVAALNGARTVWPREVLAEVESLDSSIDELEIQKRKDLRDLFTITIDGADSKDLDDAISIVPLDNGKTKLYVHIADVTHYVKEDGEIDIEALERATSIYLVDKVIPMLPEGLSNDLCSLNPNTDKYTLTCEMIIDEDGVIDLEKSNVYESVISTNYRTTYKEIEEIKDDNLGEGNKLLFGGTIDDDLVELVHNSKRLANLLNENTRKNGELEFDFPETKVIINDEGNPIDFKPYPKYPSNDWIKAFMVAANRTVSEKFESTPFLHRTHLNPKSELIEKLNEILELLETKLSISTSASSADFAKLLREIEGHEKQKFLEKTILLTMQRANYTHEREGHFGLAIDYYSHFTSPIRRYPDLQIHRIIKECIFNKREGITEDLSLTEDREYHYESILESVAEKSSIEQDKSVGIEREVNKMMGAKYMSDKIGQEFNGYLAGIDQRGVFVELENTITGTIYNEKKYSLNPIGKNGLLFELEDSNGDKYNPGDEIKVKLLSVNEETLSINFDIVK